MKIDIGDVDVSICPDGRETCLYWTCESCLFDCESYGEVFVGRNLYCSSCNGHFIVEG